MATTTAAERKRLRDEAARKNAEVILTPEEHKVFHRYPDMKTWARHIEAITVEYEEAQIRIRGHRYSMNPAEMTPRQLYRTVKYAGRRRRVPDAADIAEEIITQYVASPQYKEDLERCTRDWDADGSYVRSPRIRKEYAMAYEIDDLIKNKTASIPISSAGFLVLDAILAPLHTCKRRSHPLLPPVPDGEEDVSQIDALYIALGGGSGAGVGVGVGAGAAAAAPAAPAPTYIARSEFHKDRPDALVVAERRGTRSLHKSRIMAFIFGPTLRNRFLSDEQVSALSLFLNKLGSNPRDAVGEAGKLLGKCCLCGIALSDETSKRNGYGPVCIKHIPPSPLV